MKTDLWPVPAPFFQATRYCLHQVPAWAASQRGTAQTKSSSPKPYCITDSWPAAAQGPPSTALILPFPFAWASGFPAEIVKSHLTPKDELSHCLPASPQGHKPLRLCLFILYQGQSSKWPVLSSDEVSTVSTRDHRWGCHTAWRDM